MTKVVNPLTSRKIALEGPTARRLLRQGSVVQAGDRLLRPAHAAFEEEAARLGLPEPVWRFPPATDPDTIARVAEAVEALARARQVPDQQPAQPQLLENPLADEEVDAALDDDAPQDRAQRDETGAITWQTGAPGHSDEQVPDLLFETPDTLYTLHVDGVQYTWPAAGDNGPIAVTGEQLAADPDTFIAIEEGIPAGTTIVFMPIEMAPRIDYPQAGSVSLRSYNSAPLRAPAANDPRVVLALEALDPDRRYLLHFNQGLMDAQLSPLSWSEMGARDMRKANGAQQHNSLRGADVSAAFLYDIDRVMYEKFRYVGEVVYELRPIPEVDPDAPPGPFNHGEAGELLNCVMRALAQKLREKTQGGRPSPHLEKQRAKALDDMDKELRFGGGFTLAHVPEVERRLKIRLRALDAAGNAIVPPSKSNMRWAEVKIVLHDNHGWGELPENPPAKDIVEVRPFDAEYEQARAALGTRRYEAYEWDLESLSLAFHRRAIPQGTRVWLLGREMVTHEGVIYRAQAERTALQDAFEKEHDVRVDDLLDLVESMEGVPFDQRTEEGVRLCKLAFSFTVSTQKIGGVGSYHFGRFCATNGLDRTPKPFLDIWKKSQVESRVWCSEEDWGDAKLHPHRQLDMKAAFLACDTRPGVSRGDAADLVDSYGFPTKAMRHAKLPQGIPLTAASPCVKWTGAIQLAEWRFSAAALEQIVDAAGKHLERNDGWLTTPELYDLLESGDLEHAVGREIVYTLGQPLERLVFPDDRTLGVQLVGKCARRGNDTNIVTHDANEAAHLANALGGRLIEYKAGDSFLIKYQVDEPRPQYFHIRAFVLGYLNVARARMLRRFPSENDILRVCTDGIYAKNVPREVEGLLCQDEKKIRWGQWRDKPPGYVWTGWGQATGYRAPRAGRLSAEVAAAASKADPLPQDRPQGLDMDAVPEGLTAELLATAMFIMINGQGGCGKTYATTRMLQGRDFVVACPSNRLARRHAEELQCRTSTYHKLFGYNEAVEWDVKALGRKLARLPKTIVWDEAGNVDKRVFATILPELARRGIQVIFLMDEGQLPPWGNKEAPPATYLRETWVDEAHRITFTTDMRSRCERLKTIKRAMWMVPTATQVEVFHQEFPATSFEDALAQWHPGHDYFLVSTREMGAAVAKRLLVEHARRFPDEPARIRYDGRNCPGQKIRVPGTTEYVDHVKGIVAECPLAEVAKLSSDWAYSGWNTVHVVQGDTIDRPGRVFILDHSLTGWTENAPYTAVSRVRYADQVIRVLPHPVDMAALGRTPEGFEAAPDLKHIQCRLTSHFRVDNSKGRDIVEKPTAQYIADMIAVQNGECACCGVKVFCQGFRFRDPQAYSIDRIDDNRGHEVGNLRICCYSCNVRHKV